MITSIANNFQLGGGILTVRHRITELRELKGFAVNKLAGGAYRVTREALEEYIQNSIYAS